MKNNNKKRNNESSGYRPEAANEPLNTDYDPEEYMNYVRATSKERTQNKKTEVLFPEAPIDVFPMEISNFIKEAAKSLNCSMEYLVAAVISAISTCIGKKFSIEIKPGYVESANFYLVLIGDPGQKKTPVLKSVFQPLLDKQQQFHLAYVAEKKNYEQLLKQFDTSDSDENVLPPDVPVEYRIIATDFTIESLADILVKNKNGLLLYSD